MSKMAVIVPYRDRRKQLDIFIPHFDEFMKDKDIDYKIFVIEQRDDRPFNRGKLINVVVKKYLMSMIIFVFMMLICYL